LKVDFRTALKDPRISAIIIQIGLPFEYRASVSYARLNGVEVVPVDYSEFSMEWISTWPELISSENIESLLKLETAVIPVTQHYREAARGIARRSSSPDIWAGKDSPLWQKREGYIAAAIRSQLEINAVSRPVYIGGWQHLIARGRLKTIRDILEIEESNCILLDHGPAAGKVMKPSLPRVASLTGKC
jgi:hypothetical protein